MNGAVPQLCENNPLAHSVLSRINPNKNPSASDIWLIATLICWWWPARLGKSDATSMTRLFQKKGGGKQVQPVATSHES